MLDIKSDTRVFIYSKACDMRSGFDRLAQFVENELGTNVLHGGLFVFFNRTRHRVRILYWDEDGYAIWYKRLEAGAFRVELNSAHEEITGVDLKLLLSGVDQSRIRLKKRCKDSAMKC